MLTTLYYNQKLERVLKYKTGQNNKKKENIKQESIQKTVDCNSLPLTSPFPV